jgi:hypothetical protein
MKIVSAVIVVLSLASVASAQSIYQPYQPYRPLVAPAPMPTTTLSIGPTGGMTLDPNSGNIYQWHRQLDGSTDLRGNNIRTGSTWQTTIQPSGSMHGVDHQFNSWDYNANSKTYINYGTGQLCIGEGVTRVCTGGR